MSFRRDLRRLLLSALLLAARSASAGGQAGHDAALGASGVFTTSDSVRLHYLDAGRGRPVVFVPGWTMPGDIWEHQIRDLSRDYRTIALDPRSQGQSDIARAGHWHPRRATDIHELITHLDLRDVVLVGWSMAVPEVLTYVDLFGTARVSAFVLVDGLVWIPGGAAQGASYVAWTKQMERDRRAFAERFVRGMYRRAQSEDYIRRVIAWHLRTPTSVAATLNTNAAFGPESDKRGALGKVDRPLLYVITPGLRSHADTVKGRLPDARIEVLEGVGHALFVDASERFNEILRSFIAGR